jgi:hypothetical protein
MAGDFGASAAIQGNVNTYQTGTVSKGKKISQEGIDKIIYDIMSSDKGLANLGSLENASGGYGATDKTLMAQDLMAKLAGEIALITAEDTTTTDMTNESDTPMNRFFGEPQSMSDTTVICTELVRQGLFDPKLKAAGHEHFTKLSPLTVRGYQFWGKPIARRMASSPKLTTFMLPIVQARYEQIVNGKRSFLGSATIYFGQPVCFVIGAVLAGTAKLKGLFHGFRKQSA